MVLALVYHRVLLAKLGMAANVFLWWVAQEQPLKILQGLIMIVVQIAVGLSAVVMQAVVPQE